MVTDLYVFALASTRGMREQGGTRGSDGEGMNCVMIEEHQAEDLVFAQVYYLSRGHIGLGYCTNS